MNKYAVKQVSTSCSPSRRGSTQYLTPRKLTSFLHSPAMAPENIPPQKDDAPNIVIHNNYKYILVKPSIPKRIRVMEDILPNMKKLAFIDHDL